MNDKNSKKITQLSARAGCGGKFTPDGLAKVLCHIDSRNKDKDENLIVGFDKSDDAGVYKLSDEVALVQTLDFFTPVTNDPYLFGQIAATNALSDVYAMGGKPLTALNIACFSSEIEPEILADILKGGENKIKEAGATIVGGHTVTDDEIKYGLSVTGLVNPEKVVTNSGARDGDVLILTKPLGSGVLTTALKIEYITDEEFKEVGIVMSTLNKISSEEMQKIGVNACTDITGFGLIGHSYEMANGSGLEIEFDSSKIMIMNKVIDLINGYCIPNGAYSNQKYFEKWVDIKETVDEATKIVFYDPQTSGGLLISVSEEKAQALLENINKRSQIKAQVVGRVLSKGKNGNIITIV